MKRANQKLRAIVIVAIAFLFTTLPAFSADTWSPGAGWTLVWGDEFSGPNIDTTNWGYDLGGGGWGNNELETYTSTNAYIQNSELVISVYKTGANSYTSSRMKTQGKRSWKYGKMAARIRLPYGQGIWPAFWMLGDNITTVGWPKCGETDIMEMVGGGENRDDTVYGTLHWDANNSHASYGSGPHELPDPQFFYQDYHVFEIEWSSTEVIWKLDAVEFFRTSVDTNLWPTMNEFHNPFFFILNVAVGGNWPGNPDATTVFPQFMYVDWVRVYSNSSAPPATPTGLSASAGNQQIALSWNAVSGATSYNVKRGSSSGGPYSTIASGVTSTTHTDTGLANGTTYYYVVSAVNANGESANSSQVAARPGSAAVVKAVNSGGSAAGSFSADGSFAGGTAASSTASIDTSGVINAAPQAVYQTERYGNFTYTLTGFTAGANYTVRLHFAEFYWDNAGQRKFNVAINGTQVLSSFDILATAGGKFKATVQEFAATANASGQIVVQYTTVVDNAKSSGIEILTAGPATPPSAPTNLSAVAQKSPGKIKLTWTQSTSGGITQNKVYRSTTGSAGPYSLRATLSPTTTYTDTGLTGGATYYYVVTAVSSGGESAYSNYSGATAK
jgi:beta-glucanase (GH16 family)